MKVERLWFVLPLNLVADPNKPGWGAEIDGGGDGFAQPAPPARGNNERARRDGGLRADFNRVLGAGQQDFVPNWGEVNLQQAPAEAPQQVLKGRGFFLSSESKKHFQKGFTTEDMAITEAKTQAELNPKTPYGVFGCIAIFETTTPKIIEKTFNEAGELRVK